MNNIFPISISNIDSLKKLDEILGQDQAIERTQELVSPFIPSKFKKIFVGAVCLMTMSANTAFTKAHGRLRNISLQEGCSISEDNFDIIDGDFARKVPHTQLSLDTTIDVSLNTSFSHKIEQDIKAVLDLQVSPLEKLIDGDEIREEMEIISTYMSNVKSFYASRKKNFII